MTLPRRVLLATAYAAALAALSLSPVALKAQSEADKYPARPIRIIVPFAPGGSVEVVARLIGQDLTDAWGQPVVVETRPGGGTMIGTQVAARAEPDGYTLLVVVSNHAYSAHQLTPLSGTCGNRRVGAASHFLAKKPHTGVSSERNVGSGEQGIR